MKNKKHMTRLLAAALTTISLIQGLPVSAAQAPNSTLGRATTLPINQLIEDSMSSTDDPGTHYRYYKVQNPYNVDSVAEISITNTSTEYGDLYKTVYNSKGVAEDVAATRTWISRNNSATVYVGLKSKETKYIRLREVYESAAEANKYEDKSWTIYTEVKKEEGNSFKKAKAVKSGKTITGKGNYRNDEDYFKVTPNKKR